jgi:hypothetical protein
MVGIGFLSFIAMLAFAGLAIDKAPGGKAKGKTILFVLAPIVCGGGSRLDCYLTVRSWLGILPLVCRF